MRGIHQARIDFLYKGPIIHPWYNRPISQIQQYIRQLFHNAPFCNRNVDTCAHHCYKMVHCEIWDWCITGFVQQTVKLAWYHMDKGCQYDYFVIKFQLPKSPKQLYCCEGVNNTHLWYRLTTAPTHYLSQLMGRCTDWHGNIYTTIIHIHVRNMTSIGWPRDCATIKR